jgi:hypothetical protein
MRVDCGDAPGASKMNTKKMHDALEPQSLEDECKLSFLHLYGSRHFGAARPNFLFVATTVILSLASPVFAAAPDQSTTTRQPAVEADARQITPQQILTSK